MADDSTKELPNNDRLDRIISLVEGMDARLRAVDRVIPLVEGMDARLRAVERKVDSLEKKVDERLYDTRPLWEGVQSQLNDLRNDMDRGFRQLNKQFDALAGNMIRLDVNQRDIEARINDIESKAS